MAKFKHIKEGLGNFKLAVSQTRKKEFEALRYAQMLERKELASIGWFVKGNIFNLEKMKLVAKLVQMQSQFKF